MIEEWSNTLAPLRSELKGLAAVCDICKRAAVESSQIESSIQVCSSEQSQQRAHIATVSTKGKTCQSLPALLKAAKHCQTVLK